MLCLPVLTGCDQTATGGTEQALAEAGVDMMTGEEVLEDLQPGAIGPLRFQYDQRQLTLIEMPIMFPIGPQQQAWGAKLVPAERAVHIGQQGCVYGNPPRRRTCNARDEGGLVLSYLERPIEDYRQDFIKAGLGAELMPARLDGSRGFAYNRIRLGKRSLYRFIPVGERTLMLAEQELVNNNGQARTAIAATIRSLARTLPAPGR
ncbi:hypothetical protein PK98_06240 [Croceibacterium mercuriale]|uniref:Uncharacterized protein n=2 Tax=Croceibacterium mercuriale TaxID=1572751 RepID=A0A0B2C269_9SPHN|nr:hypothetical protein PK98_06240 [Croceibacterium mercuriale]